MQIPSESDAWTSEASLALSLMLRGAWVPQAIYATVSLGVFESLHSGPRSGAEIASAIDVPLDTTRRLLRALCCLELCSEPESGVFALTRRGRLLCADAPGSMRSVALFRSRQWSAWGRLPEVVRTGKTAPELIAGKGLWEWLADDPDHLTDFDQAMTEKSVSQARVVTDACDFSDANVIVDVGGGYGALLVALLMRHGGAKGIIFDRPTCREGAQRLVAESGLSERCRFVGGDFFDSVPEGGDVYLLKNVIHDWDDERAVTILRNCHSAMNAESRLLLIQPVAPEKASASLADAEAVASDLNMLLLTGGCERTERQHRSLLRAGGFEVMRIWPKSSALCLIEARKTVSVSRPAAMPPIQP